MNLIAKKYELKECLGKGQFGSVHQAFCIKTKKSFAVKFENEDTFYSSLKHEATVLHYLHSQKCSFIPSIFYYGNYSPYICLVMTYYTVSLKTSKENMKIKDILEWWNHSILVLEAIHKAGIVHRDLKPDHFMKDIHGFWHIIDFGLASSYLIDNEHISLTEKHTIVGSPNYVSVYVHLGYEPVRRDDYISLIYILWEYIYGTFISLPNSNEYRNDETTEDIVNIHHPYNEYLHRNKEWKRLYGLLQDSQHQVLREEMFALLTHAERLQFADKPNYIHATLGNQRFPKTSPS